MKKMRSKVLLVSAVLCWSMQANVQARAQSCAEVYGAIKSEAMYCGFFCDEAKLLPLQQDYEANCIMFVVPASALPLETPLEKLPGAAFRVRNTVPADLADDASAASPIDETGWEQTRWPPFEKLTGETRRQWVERWGKEVRS